MRAGLLLPACLGLALALACSGAGRAQSISALAAQAEAERAAKEVEKPATNAIGSTPFGDPAGDQELTLPMPRVTLYPGDALNDSVLINRPAPRTVIESGAYAPRIEALEGKVARRVLPAGVPIPMGSITDAIMVTKGVTARVVLHEGGLLISGYAVPLESGSVGSIVRLKNMNSGQTIVGEVQADGSVRIKMR